MKKCAVFLMCLIIILTMVACGKKPEMESETEPTPTERYRIYPIDWILPKISTKYETLEEAADEATFMANNVYAETNRVLTPRELMESKGVFVWLEERDAYTYANNDGFPAWVEDGVLSFKDESLDLKDADSDVLEQYGETWRVWLTKPTDSERMSSNWVK